jgi:hypothetical protein
LNTEPGTKNQEPEMELKIINFTCNRLNSKDRIFLPDEV